MMIGYDEFLEFYAVERAHAKEQITAWQERLDAVEAAYNDMTKAKKTALKILSKPKATKKKES